MIRRPIRRWFPLFMGPMVCAFIIGFVYPFCKGIYLSFCKFKVTSDAHFVGLENYRRAFQDASFVHSFWFTALFAVISLVLINVLAFAVAYALTQGIKGSNLYRTVFFMPNLIGGIVLGYIWSMIFDGILSRYGTSILLNTKLGFWGLIILMCWQQIGYMMIIYIAGLQAVPEDMLEAAKIDGASRWQTLWKVTIPNVMPSITICTFLSLTNWLQALRPEPRPHGWPALYHPVRRQLDQRDRNARAEHPQHVLRAECQLARHRAGQGRAVLHPRRDHRSSPAQCQPQKGGAAVMNKHSLSAEARRKTILSIVLGVICVIYVLPVLTVVINSFKLNTYVKTDTFALPNAESFAGWANFIKGLTFGNYPFLKVRGLQLIYHHRLDRADFALHVDGRVVHRACGQQILPHGLLSLRLFDGRAVPDGDVHTVEDGRYQLKLNTPWTIPIIYLGFGAGLAIFMFVGFIKSIPLEIEEAAAIDGCGPLRTYFSVVLPMLKPTMISVGILEIMWVWNDYLLPYLVLDRTKYMTIPIHIQYLKGSYGTVDLGATMALILLSIMPMSSSSICCARSTSSRA